MAAKLLLIISLLVSGSAPSFAAEKLALPGHFCATAVAWGVTEQRNVAKLEAAMQRFRELNDRHPESYDAPDFREWEAQMKKVTERMFRLRGAVVRKEGSLRHFVPIESGASFLNYVAFRLQRAGWNCSLCCNLRLVMTSSAAYFDRDHATLSWPSVMNDALDHSFAHELTHALVTQSNNNGESDLFDNSLQAGERRHRLRLRPRADREVGEISDVNYENGFVGHEPIAYAQGYAKFADILERTPAVELKSVGLDSSIQY